MTNAHRKFCDITLFFGIAFAIFGLMLGGCAHMRDRGMFYTEQGLEAAERAWDQEYYRKLAECKAKYPPQTTEANLCFRDYYEADKIVAELVEEAVRLLRDYWRLRAEGYEPSYKDVARHVKTILAGLPDRARIYFLRVEGV